MIVLITGATGFTGSQVVPLFIKRGYSVRCFKRPGSNTRRLPQTGIEWRTGDLGDWQSLRAAMEGADLLVNLASLGFGHAPLIVRAALAAGIKRAVFISTTAIFTTLNAASRSVRIAAEEAVANSGLAYTLLRPTMIYGNGDDRNMSRLIHYLQRFPLIPILGDGGKKQQPVYVGDVAKAVADCIGRQGTVGKAYNIPGRKPLSYNEVIQTVGEILGRRIYQVHFPEGPFIALLSLFEKTGIPLPIKAEQIKRLNEDKMFAYEKASQDFGYTPLSFREGLTLQIQNMGLGISTPITRGLRH